MDIFFIDKKLDKYQRKAVLCNKRAYLVVAGAGSGKTLTIVSKVDYLKKHGIKEKNILCISFTNETVNSLKNRLEENNLHVDVKTFHKLSLDILNNEYNVSNNNLLDYIIDEYFNSIMYYDNLNKLLDDSINIDNLKNVVLTFINQLKSLNLNQDYVLSLLRDKIPNEHKIILLFIFRIYVLYQEELKSENKIDFNDMINLASKKIEYLKSFKYSYIIIDEYQDTSDSKYLLIKRIMDKFNINIMAVGDDYQSIYSFTGCNLKMFTNFKKYFNKSKIIKMKNTYRNPYDIVEISRRFILKNRNQINKRLKSNKHLNDSINVVYIKNEEEAFLKIIEDIDNIFVLGRNNKDLDNIKSLNVDRNIKYLTVHKSKGLEEDYVIVLNVIDDSLGFPNKIKENEVLNYLMNYNHLEEERRLFYVALTRAKKKVFLFTIKGRESIFIKELLKNFKYKIKIYNLE